jgi:hypothetical protein
VTHDPKGGLKSTQIFSDICQKVGWQMFCLLVYHIFVYEVNCELETGEAMHYEICCLGVRQGPKDISAAFDWSVSSYII